MASPGQVAPIIALARSQGAYLGECEKATGVACWRYARVETHDRFEGSFGPGATDARGGWRETATVQLRSSGLGADQTRVAVVVKPIPRGFRPVLIADIAPVRRTLRQGHHGGENGHPTAAADLSPG